MPGWARNLRIVEMDQPTTQAAKIAHFSQISFLSPEEAAATYYSGRHDLPVPPKTYLCTAIV
jgi:hypothetical protein